MTKKSKSNQSKPTDDQIIENEQKKIAAELEEYQKNPDIGLNVDRLIAFANGQEFKINPEGHIKKNKDAIRKIQNQYEADMNKAIVANNILKQNDIYEDASRQILEIGLVDFNYTHWANHISIGPTVLGQLSNEVATFLVVQGGRAGFKHWQMQQRSETLNRLNFSASMKNSTKNS